MRILVVCHRFPYPPDSGAKVRAFHIIKHLARDHEVTVVSPVRSAEEAAAAPGIEQYCARYVSVRLWEPLQALRMVACLATPVPSSIAYFQSMRLARQAKATLDREQFDLVIAMCSSVAHYISRTKDVPKILDFVDMDSQKWLEYARYKPFPLSLGYRLEGKKLEREERRLAKVFDLCTVTTRAEWETLESYGTGVATDWFPNGVDGDYFAPTGVPHDPDTICFVGRMDYYPNQECMFDFCANALPRIRAKRPETKLLVVGADPPRTVMKLGELPGVTVTGSVPDVRPHLRRAALVVAPLNIARGTQNKILEAMAAGVPVVASRVAAGGVDAVAGEHFAVATTPEEHAQAILRILGDSAERRRLAVAGRERMLSHHAWDRSMQRLDRIIDRCLAVFRERLAGGEIDTNDQEQTDSPMATNKIKTHSSRR
jgi:sugar transferase (PEP-CTERM/EpsH1 system associated)